MAGHFAQAKPGQRVAQERTRPAKGSQQLLSPLVRSAMPVSRELALGLLAALVVLAPLASAHVLAPTPPPGVATQESELTPPTAGYTGPGTVPYLSFFAGSWLYGQSSSTPIGKQQPRHIIGSGDWLAWEDTVSGRIFVYKVPAASGCFLGNATAYQPNQ